MLRPWGPSVRQSLIRTICRFTGLIAVLALLTLSVPAHATPVKQAPWEPDVAAYRTGLFLSNMTPVAWGAIEQAWSIPIANTTAEISGYEALTRRPGGREMVTRIRRVIALQDSQTLFEISTRVMAEALLQALDQAEKGLGDGTARGALLRAAELYRAFGDGIRLLDPDGYRATGLAWLELNSAVGNAGVLGAGTQAADPVRFRAALLVITNYVADNYAPARFTPRQQFNAAPEGVAASGASIELAPTLPPGASIANQDPFPLLVLNFEAGFGIDEKALPLVAYGDMLFDSPAIFGEVAQNLKVACSTCHNRSDINRDFFIPGVSHQPGAADVDGGFFNPLFNDLRADSLDTPSLRGIRLTGPYGRDGRFGSLRMFTRNVIVNEFAGPEPTPFMLDTLMAYMREFDFLPNSKITTDGQLTDLASNAARRGEVLFNTEFGGMNGQSCASCHDPSANFLDRRTHDIGTQKPAYPGALAQAFDTPTLLSVASSGPYFHDGSQPTLAAVVGWFDTRFSLGLSEVELADLTAYVETVGGADEAYQFFDEVNTAFRLSFDELTTFASTLDTLIPTRDARHALLLIDTVAPDLAADASLMLNQGVKPDAYRLAAILTQVGDHIRAGDWGAANAAWGKFKTLQDAVAEGMF
jgi:cytochrome c peroxidase